MSLGLSDRQARERRQLLWGLVKWTFLGFLALVAGLFVYQTGLFVGQHDVERLENQVTELTSRVEALQIESAGYKARASQAQQELQQLQQRYQSELPSGDAKALLDLAAKRLNDGVQMDRLTFLLQAASPRVCDPEPEAQRLIVAVPDVKPGKRGTATLAKGAIVVTAEGASALDAKGNKEAWYDPAQPVTLHVALADGTVRDVVGTLPLEHRLVAGSSEFRLAIAADEKKSYAAITAERCNFP